MQLLAVALHPLHFAHQSPSSGPSEGSVATGMQRRSWNLSCREGGAASRMQRPWSTMGATNVRDSADQQNRPCTACRLVASVYTVAPCHGKVCTMVRSRVSQSSSVHTGSGDACHRCTGLVARVSHHQRQIYKRMSYVPLLWQEAQEMALANGGAHQQGCRGRVCAAARAAQPQAAAGDP
jgi:hypothetical protein